MAGLLWGSCLMDVKLVSDDGQLLRLAVEGRVVQSDSTPGLEPIGKLLGQQGYARRVVLSLADTEYIDSSGLSWLLVCHKRFCQAGGRLVIHSVPPGVMETIRMMRLDRVLYLADDEQAAAKLAQGDSQ